MGKSAPNSESVVANSEKKHPAPAPKSISTSFDYKVANKNAKIRTYPSKAQMTAEKHQARKRASQRALSSPSLEVATAESTAQAEQDNQGPIKDTVTTAANKESDRAATKPASLNGFSHQPVPKTSKVSNSKVNKVEPKETTPGPTTDLPGRKGFLTVGTPGVGKPVVKQTHESSKKNKNGAAQNKRYQSAETVVDESSEDKNENSTFSRTSKSKKSTSDKKNREASQISKSKKIRAMKTREA
ncbi:hypothetical protein HBI09_003790 [Parastagonospora nodorum]|nr:hypothetical protein HBI09_003790 [Parastagonospora nodorum]KAH5027660.1 hypothetical protein HBI77_003800 [Parastagonospora nodorum]